MQKQKTKPHQKKPVFNPFEQVLDLGKDTVKKAGAEMVNIVNPFPDMWGNPTPKPESMPGGPNFNPLDFDKLNNHYDKQDSSGIDQIRQQLMGFQKGDDSSQEKMKMPEEQEKLKRHREYKQEEAEFIEKLKQEEAEEEREEAMEEEQKQLAEDQANQQPLEAPKGKVRKSILGGGHKKANMELPPEVRSERKGGAGKH